VATPSEKSPEMEQMLEKGRITAIKADRCVPAPYRCGKPAVEFKDRLSEKEYTISGLCQVCQDEVWG